MRRRERAQTTTTTTTTTTLKPSPAPLKKQNQTRAGRQTDRQRTGQRTGRARGGVGHTPPPFTTHQNQPTNQPTLEKKTHTKKHKKHKTRTQWSNHEPSTVNKPTRITSDASLQEDPKRISPEDPRARGFFNFDRRSPDRGFFDLMVHDSPIG